MIIGALKSLGSDKNTQPSNPNGGEVIVWYLESGWGKIMFGKFHLSSVSYKHRTAFLREVVVISRCRQSERMARGWHSKHHLLNSLRWPIYVINSVDNIKLPCVIRQLVVMGHLLSRNYISIGIEYTQMNLPIIDLVAITIVIAYHPIVDISFNVGSCF